MPYFKRHIDDQLQAWKTTPHRKPLLIRGARQVGKSTAVRELGKSFRYFLEINLERQPDLRQLFTPNIDVKKTCENLSGTLHTPIIPGETLLFIDEIQMCKEAIMSLRYFKEDYPELHVIAAGSLLEFALEELPSFGVGRIRSLHMYPFSFDEFLMAQGLDLMVDYKKKATSEEPLPELAHKNLIDQLRSFYLVGGMPAAVAEWVETHSYLEVSRIHTDILETYQDDFAKYKKRVSPVLLRQALRSVALQAGSKFVYAAVASDLRSSVVKDALHLLTLAGLILPVKHSSANGLPLGAEENSNYVKYLFFDLGVMLTMLGAPASDTLLASEIEFVNKGAASEMFAGLELAKYADCYQKTDLHYWQNNTKNSLAEVDYLTVKNGHVLPVEVKASTQGSMQSLWVFLRKHHLQQAVRTSLENFGAFVYCDKDDENAERHVKVLPLYALSNL
ncbi:MAG: AAA family ATPase [Bacteroidales bacterium]|nr:AAA family ATPase [Bacteroidales bacterium]